MSERSYLIALGPSADVAAIKDYIKLDDGFSHWWNHLPGVFMVTSGLTADEITEKIRPLTGDARFLVVRVDLNDTEGWLPQKSWQWIKHRERDTDRSDPASRIGKTMSR